MSDPAGGYASPGGANVAGGSCSSGGCESYGGSDSPDRYGSSGGTDVAGRSDLPPGRDDRLLSPSRAFESARDWSRAVVYTGGIPDHRRDHKAV